MSLIERFWRALRPPIAYVSLALGSILGVTALGMVSRGLLVEGSIPPGLLSWSVGAVVFLGLGFGLRAMGPG